MNPHKSLMNGQLTFRSAASLFFLVCALTYVPITNATMLKNGVQVCSGKNFWANASATGDVTQLTFMTGMNPARTVARTWWKVLAPAMRAMNTRYMLFWIGAICGGVIVSVIMSTNWRAFVLFSQA